MTGGVIIIVDDNNKDPNCEAKVRQQAGLNHRQVKKVKYHVQAAPSQRAKHLKTPKG